MFWALWFKKEVKALWFLVLMFVVVGCATQPDFSEYHGAPSAAGIGGTTRVVRGMEVWDNGKPNRPFQILGEMRSAGGGWSDIDYELQSIVIAAQKKGADALILESAEENLTGINLSSGRFNRSPSVRALLIKYL